MMRKAIGYCRVSTEEQTEGTSIEAQEDALRKYADLYDIDLVRIEIDAGASAKTLKRDGLQSALEALEGGEAEALIVHKLDRLTRSVADLGRLIETIFQRVELLSVVDHIDTRTANGRLVINMLASVSQWERETVAERTRTSLRYLKEQGRTYNHPPLGFAAVDGYLSPLEEEQLIVSEIKTMRDSGLSLHKIAADLNDRGIVGKRGGKFYASTIRAILGNDLHIPTA